MKQHWGIHLFWLYNWFSQIIIINWVPLFNEAGVLFLSLNFCFIIYLISVRPHYQVLYRTHDRSWHYLEELSWKYKLLRLFSVRPYIAVVLCFQVYLYGIYVILYAQNTTNVQLVNDAFILGGWGITLIVFLLYLWENYIEWIYNKIINKHYNLT